MPRMAGIITAVASKGCASHRTITVGLDGSSFSFDLSQADLDAMPWTNPDKQAFILAGLKRLRTLGMTLDQALGLVCNGDEGNNVKIYPIVTKDITKTNVGTSYVNVPIGASGERKFANFTGCTQFRVRIWANLVATGPFGFRMVRDGDNEVFYENASIALTGERELDTDWQAIPAAFQNAPDGVLLRLQIKSATATDDPVVRGCDLGAR